MELNRDFVLSLVYSRSARFCLSFDWIFPSQYIICIAGDIDGGNGAAGGGYVDDDDEEQHTPYQRKEREILENLNYFNLIISTRSAGF